MICIKNKKECCGCEACFQVCPVGAINMKRDSEGFLYPIVDKKKCINCSLCERTCPLINKKVQEEKENVCLLAKNRGNDRFNSSSGGIFVIIANWILTNGGSVYGAMFNSKWEVHHGCVNEKKDVWKIMGSKYLQSTIDGSFIEIKKQLESRKPVLFSGTACQIAGLKSFLKKDYDELYTVDVLCHGVPSPLVWEKYIIDLKNRYKSDILNVNFRDKGTGWHEYSTRIDFTNGNYLFEKYTSNIYMNMFLKNFILRPSCYSCKFKDINRQSDLTIGDAWGIELLHPEFDDDKGISVIISHSEKGKKIINEISKEIDCLDAELDIVLPPTADSRQPVKMPRGRALLFYRLKKNKSIDKMAASMEYNVENKILTRIIKN